MTPDGLYQISTPPGMTRNCLDAWSMVFVRADGGVCICCYTDPIGNLADNSLDQILNNRQALAYRNGLLTGKLLPKCVSCPDKKTTTLQHLEERVQAFLSNGDWGSDETHL